MKKYLPLLLIALMASFLTACNGLRSEASHLMHNAFLRDAADPASVHVLSEDVVLLTDSICVLHAVVRDRSSSAAFDRHGYEYYYGHIDGERREFIRRLDTIPPLHELVHNTLDYYEQEYGVPRYKARNIAAEYVATITLLFDGEIVQ